MADLLIAKPVRKICAKFLIMELNWQSARIHVTFTASGKQCMDDAVTFAGSIDFYLADRVQKFLDICISYARCLYTEAEVSGGFGSWFLCNFNLLEHKKSKFSDLLPAPGEASNDLAVGADERLVTRD